MARKTTKNEVKNDVKETKDVIEDMEKEIEEKTEEEKSETTTETETLSILEKINAKVQNKINAVLEKKSIETIDLLNDNTKIEDYIDTGFLGLNYIITGDLNKGYPVGRITEIAGDPSTGKTLLSTIAAIQGVRKGYLTYYLDGEQAYDIGFARLVAKSMGENKDIVNLINYKAVDKIEETTQIITTILDVVEKNKVDNGVLIILDGLAFLTTQKEEEDVMGNKQKVDMTKAKLIRQFMRVVKNKLKHSKAAMLITNQLTYNIGVMYGDPKVTTGGTAVPFASSVRIRITSKKIMEDKKMVGLMIKATTKKNRLNIPFKSVEFPIFLKDKIYREQGLLDALIDDKVIVKVNNSSYKLYNESDDERFTKKEFYTSLIKNKDFLEKLNLLIEVKNNE